MKGLFPGGLLRGLWSRGWGAERTGHLGRTGGPRLREDMWVAQPLSGRLKMQDSSGMASVRGKRGLLCSSQEGSILKQSWDTPRASVNHWDFCPPEAGS